MHEELHVELPRCTLEDFDPSAVQHESMWTQRKANQRRIRAIRDVTRNMLRHGHYHCVPDDEGWVSVRWLLSQPALKRHLCTREDLEEAVEASEGRIEPSPCGTYLRVTRGHTIGHVSAPTIPVCLHEIPEILYHCTKQCHVANIDVQGLLPPSHEASSRQVIFLSTHPRTANGKRGVVYAVQARRLFKAGCAAMHWCGEGGRDTGILQCTGHIPATFISRVIG